MTAVIVVAAIAVVGAVVARVTWRRPGDERHSIQTHQQTLETLRSMADRRPGLRETSPEAAPPANGTRARPVPPTAAGGPGGVRSNPAPSPSTRAVPSRSPTGRAGAVRTPVPAAGNGHGGKDLVFVDDAPAAAGAASEPMIRTSSFPLAKGLPGRGHRRTRPFGSSRRTRLGPVVAAVGVLVVVAGLAVALAPSHHAPPARADRPPRTAATGGHRQTTTTTTTTTPQVHPSSSTTSTADYSVPATGYTVALQASGLCWVEATSASTGNVVWTGTLQSGQAHSIAGTGTMILRLGAANDIAVRLDGEPVMFPAGFQSPFDMTFTTT